MKSLDEMDDDLPFARTLFEASEGLRGSVESAEYKHLVLGLIFLKYVSDAFNLCVNEVRLPLDRGQADLVGTKNLGSSETAEVRAHCTARKVFWLPPEARWGYLDDLVGNAEIGTALDLALQGVDRENPSFPSGGVPQIYRLAPIAPSKLGELVKKIGAIDFPGDRRESRDYLGRTYEYFIKMFAKAEGHRGGEYYTPPSVANLLIEMLEPYRGIVFDPASGSCGLFVQSADFLTAHGGDETSISICGQENNQATWRIGQMNLAIHGLEGDVRHGDSLLDDQFPNLRADFVLANPPFNLRGWGADSVLADDRWTYGSPSDSNANYAWIQHFIHHLDEGGRAGFVLGNGSLTSTSSGEAEIRRRIIEDDLVDCIVTLPAQLFFTTSIPVSLWFLDRNKKSNGTRERTGETLFIDARQLGRKISRSQSELDRMAVGQIKETYHAWRGQQGSVAPYRDVPGYCASATIDEIRGADFSLSPGRYVGLPPEIDNSAHFESQLEAAVDELRGALDENHRAERELTSVLSKLGYG